MPNWCKNILILRCNDPAQIQRAVKAYNETKLLSEFFPKPTAVDPSDTWEEWRLQNWGTKWDVGRVADLEFPIVINETGTQVTLKFLSAGSPPLDAMRALEDAGLSVELYYCEYGLQFCGLYTTGAGDESYNFHGTIAEIREKIPDYINDFLGISEFCEEFESRFCKSNSDAR